MLNKKQQWLEAIQQVVSLLKGLEKGEQGPAKVGSILLRTYRRGRRS